MSIDRALKALLVLFFAFALGCPARADKDSLNEELKEIVNEDKVVKNDENKEIRVEIKPYLHGFDEEDGRGFDCDMLCVGQEEYSLEQCLKSCGEAEEKAKENRRAAQCAKPENMELVPAGSFLMGCTGDCRFFDIMTPPTIVIITNDLYVDKYEVTQKEYESAMGYNPSYYQGKKCGEECPVESVTWEEANSYCAAAGKRLPTSAEWEYAARGGSTTRHYWGDEIDLRYFWYKNNSGKKPKPVGLKLPNNYGLYDVEGNVFEFTRDCKSLYQYIRYRVMRPIQGKTYPYFGSFMISQKIFVDPQYAEDDCEKRIIRGGSFAYEGKGASVFYDYEQDVNERRGDRGFRCVMDAHGPQCAGEDK